MTHNDDDQLAQTWAELKAHRPSAGDVDRRATELIDRARLVQQFGWDEYRHTWSSGEVAGTALLLGDYDALATTHDTEQTTLETWAADLWGINGGQHDTDNGLERTRAWFYALRQQLTNLPTEGHSDD